MTSIDTKLPIRLFFRKFFSIFCSICNNTVIASSQRTSSTVVVVLVVNLQSIAESYIQMPYQVMDIFDFM